MYLDCTSLHFIKCELDSRDRSHCACHIFLSMWCRAYQAGQLGVDNVMNAVSLCIAIVLASLVDGMARQSRKMRLFSSTAVVLMVVFNLVTFLTVFLGVFFRIEMCKIYALIVHAVLKSLVIILITVNIIGMCTLKFFRFALLLQAVEFFLVHQSLSDVIVLSFPLHGKVISTVCAISCLES